MVNKLTAGMSLTANGFRDWLVQRFSSVILAIYILMIVGFFILHPVLNFVMWQEFFAHAWMQIFTLIVLLSMFTHAWIGIWTVVTDYVHPTFVRLIVQALIIVSLIIYFFWGIKILWRFV
jgi:succinate dehydrogenase / fumarate reductase membrane anchor subunit